MNIFVTDLSPEISAINLDDKRCIHMPKETFEILSICIQEKEKKALPPLKVPYWQKDTGLRTYEGIKSHPVTQWALKSNNNIHWTTDHCFYLIQECFHRGYREKGIVYEKIFNLLYSKYLKYYVMDNVLKPENMRFRNSSLYKDSEVIQAYRDTMNNKWFVTDVEKPPMWTNREPPSWIKSDQLTLF